MGSRGGGGALKIIPYFIGRSWEKGELQTVCPSSKGTVTGEVLWWRNFRPSLFSSEEDGGSGSQKRGEEIGEDLTIWVFHRP